MTLLLCPHRLVDQIFFQFSLGKISSFFLQLNKKKLKTEVLYTKIAFVGIALFPFLSQFATLIFCILADLSQTHTFFCNVLFEMENMPSCGPRYHVALG